MCGRFTLKTPVAEIAELFEVDSVSESARLGPRFNIAPTQPIAAVRRDPETGARELTLLRWGLVPWWSERPEELPTLINARAESLHRRRAFRDSLRRRRCLVVADGFYEWRAEGGGKQPYYVRLRSGEPFAFAALWDRWRGGEEPVESCTIVTTDASAVLEPIHDRMPVILAPADRSMWLDESVEKYAELEPALQPYPSEMLEVYRVDRRVNRPDFDEPTCIQPLERDGESAEARRAGDGPDRGGEEAQERAVEGAAAPEPDTASEGDDESAQLELL